MYSLFNSQVFWKVLLRFMLVAMMTLYLLHHPSSLGLLWMFLRTLTSLTFENRGVDHQLSY